MRGKLSLLKATYLSRLKCGARTLDRDKPTPHRRGISGRDRVGCFSIFLKKSSSGHGLWNVERKQLFDITVNALNH